MVAPRSSTNSRGDDLPSQALGVRRKRVSSLSSMSPTTRTSPLSARPRLRTSRGGLEALDADRRVTGCTREPEDVRVDRPLDFPRDAPLSDLTEMSKLGGELWLDVGRESLEALCPRGGNSGGRRNRNPGLAGGRRFLARPRAVRGGVGCRGALALRLLRLLHAPRTDRQQRGARGRGRRARGVHLSKGSGWPFLGPALSARAGRHILAPRRQWH